MYYLFFYKIPEFVKKYVLSWEWTQGNLVFSLLDCQNKFRIPGIRLIKKLLPLLFLILPINIAGSFEVADLDYKMNQIQAVTKVNFLLSQKNLSMINFSILNALPRPLFSFVSANIPHSFRGSETINSPQPMVLRYADAQHVVQLFSKKEFGLLSATGHLNADPLYNTIWVQDAPVFVEQFKKLIRQIDQPVPQILITARIVNVDTDFVRALGVFFKTGSYQAILPIAHLGQEVLLDATLAALEKQGHARLISNPQIMTMNRKPAVIESGEEIPYQQTAYNGATTISFKKAVLRLQVIPELIPDDHVLLHLNINQDQVSALVVNGVPAINTQQIETQVVMKNHTTLVLGGIFEQIQSQQHQGVPGLKSLPMIGNIFRYQENVHHHKQLLIFVTPSIIHPL